MTYLKCSTWGFPTRRLQARRLGALLAAFLLAGGAPRGAVGQGAGVDALVKRGREAGVDANQMQRVAERARQSGLTAGATATLLRPPVWLAEQGLPAGPLLAKTLEGLAKQVPRARLQTVLRKQRLYAEQAGQIVGRWEPVQEGRSKGNVPGDLTEATAEALREGAPPEDIEAFLNGLPEEANGRPLSAGQVTAAVQALPELQSRGARPETARQLLISAIEAGVGPESIRQLPSALQGARRETGRPLGALAEGAAKALARGTPATRVLGGLFPGSLPGGVPAGAGPPGTTPGVGKPPAGPPSDPGPPGGPPRGGG